MSASYVVARAPGRPVVGLLTADQVRRQLAAGTLRPSDVCVPAGATGDLGRQWRPLSAVFGDVPADPPGVAPPPPPLAPPSRAPGPSGPPPRPAPEALGEALLVFGQLVTAVASAASAAVPCLLFAFAIGGGFGRPEVSPGWAALSAFGALLSAGFWAALFVVFSRARRAMPG